MTVDELKDEQAKEAKTGPYGFWSRPHPRFNVKDKPGFNFDNVNHLFGDINVMGVKRADGTVNRDGALTRSEFVHGRLNQPADRPCDEFESTEYTHGANLHSGTRCDSKKGGVAVNWGMHKDDGQHGFTVMLSDVPCTDKDGCPSVNDKGANVTICETRLNQADSGEPQAYSIDCKGATGKYVHSSCCRGTRTG